MSGVRERVTGVVLAGGRGPRLGGGAQGLQLLRGRPMVASVLARLAPQVDEILINANQNPEPYAGFGHRLAPDAIGGFAGPLAGLHAALGAAAHPLVLTVPCDSPFLPNDLVPRLRAALDARSAELAVARTGSQPHPVFALARRSLLANLETFLAAGGRKIDAWYAPLVVVEVAFDDEAEAFSNINTRDELAAQQSV